MNLNVLGGFRLRSWRGLGLCLAFGLACVVIAAGCNGADAGNEDTVLPAEGWDDLPAASPGTDDWPWWRGPGVNNIARPDQSPPLEWSEDKNILWRVSLDGKGHGTPCIWGDRIFLASGDKAGGAISIMCLDRDTGKEKWRTEVYKGKLPKIHRDNSYASGMIVCDGQRVFFAYQTPDAIRLAALDVDGKAVWDQEVAKYETVQGHSTSPAIYKSAIIVVADCKGAARLVALHRKTGKVIWRAARPGDKESYGSPLVANVAGRDQLFVIGPGNTHSYDPGTGKFLWVCDGPAEYCAATVAFDKDKIYSTGGYPEKALLAIRADGKGNVTKTHLKWKSDRKAGYVPSPLVAGGFAYAVSDKGLMRCYATDSGKVAWERHLQGAFYSSPVLVGHRIYLFDRNKGKGFVLQAGGEFKLLAENTLKKGAFATPVILGGRIYLRTLGDLYCIGTKQE
ncbi:MAG: PQQ-binding-like beta-propeller repeat protein [Phycisphaerae bacterium]|jgi:outer membrane protein assembly factor BamB|nr:PQQ-binding-like beta-propeller repeat protein [Phycisphaerae bacterium]